MIYDCNKYIVDIMPYISHHFEGRENSTTKEPPWGVEAKENGKGL